MSGACGGCRENAVSSHRTSPGTSLIEVLVALALILVLVGGAAGMMIMALRAERRGDVVAAIAHAVEDRLESLKSRPFDDPALAAGSYAETLTVEPGGVLIAETWEISDEDAGAKRIRLRAREAGRNGPPTAAVLFVSRDLGFRP